MHERGSDDRKVIYPRWPSCKSIAHQVGAMFGFVNVCTLALFAAVGAIVLGEQLNAETNSQSIDADIEQVENSLSEVQGLLQQIEQDPEQRKQFAELSKHVTNIKEQLRIIQEEYHMNKDLDQFHNRLTEWGEQSREIGDRLKRDLEAFHFGGRE